MLEMYAVGLLDGLYLPEIYKYNNSGISNHLVPIFTSYLRIEGVGLIVNTGL